MKNHLAILTVVLCFCVACTNETSKVVTTETSPGTGAWICTLAGAGMMSQCVRRKESI